MNHLEKFYERELSEMQEKATNFIWHARMDNPVKDIIKIALVEINKELNIRKLRKENLLCK